VVAEYSFRKHWSVTFDCKTLYLVCLSFQAGEPHFRFYAGVPLETPEGLPIGTLCVLDYKRRVLTEKQAFALKALARQVMIQLELRRLLVGRSNYEHQLRASELSYRRLFEAARDGIFILDIDTGRITDVNPYLIECLGFSRDEMIGRTVGNLVRSRISKPTKPCWSDCNWMDMCGTRICH
jgi:PAS domain-containing protein